MNAAVDAATDLTFRRDALGESSARLLRRSGHIRSNKMADGAIRGGSGGGDG